MCDVEETVPAGALRDRLIAAGHLIPLGVKGVYGRSGVMEHVIERFEACVTTAGADQNAQVMRFPPIFSRAHYSRINHIHNFPDLLGSIHAFTGDERAHRRLSTRFMDGDDWTTELEPAESMLIPAACYPLYPVLTGALPAAGRLVDLRSFVFRHEPSEDPARMQIFRQREFVRLGTADEALGHREDWLERAQGLLVALGLPVERVIANDPFFGRGGRLAKATQLEQALKWELVVPVSNDDKPTAVASCNLHLDYFGLAFDITDSDGAPAHTACVGFGLERVALALFRHHGLDPERWPAEIRDRLDRGAA